MTHFKMLRFIWNVLPKKMIETWHPLPKDFKIRACHWILDLFFFTICDLNGINWLNIPVPSALYCWYEECYFFTLLQKSLFNTLRVRSECLQVHVAWSYTWLLFRNCKWKLHCHMCLLFRGSNETELLVCVAVLIMKVPCLNTCHNKLID